MNNENVSPADWCERLRARLEDIVNFEKSIELLLRDLQRQDERLLGLSNSTDSDFTENIRRRVKRYSTAVGREPRDDSAYWQNVHSNLNGLLDVLREHPVMERAIYTYEGELVIGIDMFVSRRPRQQVRFMVVGLVDFAVEHTPRCAVSAFDRLISEGERRELNSYEMVLFRGLNVERPQRISEDLCLIPWEEARQYIQDIAVRSLLGNDYRIDDLPIAAIASHANWGPLFVSEKFDFEGDWPDSPKSIRDDALLFINLLSVTHRLGLQGIGYTYNGVSRDIDRLIGSDPSFSPPSMFMHNLNFSLDNPKGPQMSMDKYAGAKKLFPKVREAPERLKLALSRLASSLSRAGPFSELDGIIDVAIALEAMYDVNPPELTYRLATRASHYLEDNAEGRISIYHSVRTFYRARSNIVHGGIRREVQIFDAGLETARRTLTKLLLEGGPSNSTEWDELVIFGEAK